MQGGAMTPAVDEEVSACQSTIPLLSRRRGSLLASSTLDTSGNDIERGGSALEAEESINVRVKTAGDGREYKLSTPLTATVSEVSEHSIRRVCLLWQGGGFSRIIAMMSVVLVLLALARITLAII